MRDFKYDAFLSHSSSDKEFVKNIAMNLKDRGLHIWFDDWIIKLGSDITSSIEKGLEDSRTLILFMSDKSLNSDWVNLERNTAIFRDPMNNERRFVPVLIDDCSKKIPDMLRRYKYLDLTNPTDESLSKLVDVCSISSPKKKTASWKIRFDGELSENNEENIAIILKKLKEITTDISIKITNIEKGSVVITLEGNEESYEILLNLLSSNLLSKQLEKKVLDITDFKITSSGKKNYLDELFLTCISKMKNNNLMEALILFKTLIREATHANDMALLAKTRCNLGIIYEEKGEYQKAISHHNIALKLDLELDYKYGIAQHYYHLGYCYFELGIYLQAKENFLNAENIYSSIGDESKAADVSRYISVLNEGKQFHSGEVPTSILPKWEY